MTVMKSLPWFGFQSVNSPILCTTMFITSYGYIPLPYPWIWARWCLGDVISWLYYIFQSKLKMALNYVLTLLVGRGEPVVVVDGEDQGLVEGVAEIWKKIIGTSTGKQNTSVEYYHIGILTGYRKLFLNSYQKIRHLSFAQSGLRFSAWLGP